MATRGSVFSYAHVEALNRIDLEFSDNKKYKKVINAWKEYFDNLSQNTTPEQIAVWGAKNDELLANLLFEMGTALNYDFDKVLIKRNVYSPVRHGNVEKEYQAIRIGLLELLNGDRAIPMNFIQNQDMLDNQQELQDLMKKYYQSQIGEK